MTVETMNREFTDTGNYTSYMKGRPVWYAQFCEKAEWLTEIPPNIVYESMRRASHDYIECLKRKARGEECELPRSRYNKCKSFYVITSAISKKGFHTRRLGEMKTSKPLPDKCRDSRVVREYNRWYLYVPVEITRQQQTENQWRVGAIDPGVRNFATVFSELGIAKIGEGSFQRIVRLCHSLDRLIGLIKKSTHKKKKRLKRAENSLWRKIRNLVTDIHYQSLGWLFRNFDALIIPECNFTSAVSKIKRKITKKSVRSLLTWAFATFRDRAISVAERLGKKVYIVNEAYTSKTANWTGEIVHNLGGAKSIKSGGLRLDRDVNGALGIYLKALMGDPSLRQVA
jgi:putative transposase